MPYTGMSAGNIHDPSKHYATENVDMGVSYIFCIRGSEKGMCVYVYVHAFMCVFGLGMSLSPR